MFIKNTYRKVIHASILVCKQILIKIGLNGFFGESIENVFGQ